ncbi:hypothetical protein LZQ00_03730 [Sphingobacterium sp. SRCM116780]|uniref:hypothetical protein n=1 Tax=Sphingobacterium sp. SRCM116780 TaxID=2907623 RepID=UPI001F45D870|nr:hypothetical protein [Sphingobacterium sp. SRCM116780]UIR56931.1 hypothetical protein LZQ00_03730 [Sphingobacterium sp. SRCM116780]
MIHTAILIFTGIFGGLLTYYFNNKLKLGGVLSSSLLTCIVAGSIHFFPSLLPEPLAKHIPLVFIGSSFVGMVSSNQLSTFIGVALSGLVYSLIYINTSQFFDGFGGALGTSACISLLVIMSIPYLRSNKKMTLGFFQLRKMIFKDKKKKKSLK